MQQTDDIFQLRIGGKVLVLVVELRNVLHPRASVIVQLSSPDVGPVSMCGFVVEANPLGVAPLHKNRRRQKAMFFWIENGEDDNGP